MKRYSPLFLIPAVLAASSELSTLTSTVLSTATCDGSTCESSTIALAPSSFVYNNATYVGKLAGSSSDSSSTISSAGATDDEALTLYEYETVTTDDLYEVVQTVCDTYSNCYVTTNLEQYTTYTATVDGVLTVITTAIPYTSDADAVDTVSTTTDSDILTTSAAETTTLDQTRTVTITSCSDICYTTTAVEKLTTSTTTVNGVETIYTTYCPLSGATSTTAEAKVASEGTETKTDISTTLVTITSCKENKCSLVTEATGVTTVTEDNTVYTTYCPLTSEETAETKTDLSTTLVTITSCKEDKCSLVTQPTGVTTVTVDNTVYTTYCPLTSEETTETTPTSEVDLTVTKTNTLPASSSKAKTIDVITDNIVTQTPSQSATTVVQSLVTESLVPLISTYEGSAALIRTGFFAIAVSFVLALI